MRTGRRILYAVDFDAIEAAVTWQVTELARALRAGVVLIASRRRAFPLGLRPESAEEVGRRLAGVAVRLKGYVADVRIVTAPLAEAALAAATELQPDLIIAGAGARAAKQPAYVGATALALARRAVPDVWICKPYADPRLEHLLCSVDTSRAGDSAVTRSLELARRFHARLRLVSVLAEPRHESAGADAEEAVEIRRRDLRAFVDRFDFRGVPLSRSVMWDREPSAELVAEARAFWDGLLVLPASRSARSHGVLEETAELVLRNCPSSILLVRPPPAAEGVAEPEVGGHPGSLHTALVRS